MRRGVVILLLAFAGAARADTDILSGRLMFYQAQGNFCPAGASCAGATYLQSQYNTYNPVADTKVYVQHVASGIVVGQGTTDANGNFTISCYAPAPFVLDVVKVFWLAEHKDGVFTIRSSGGGQRRFDSNAFWMRAQPYFQAGLYYGWWAGTWLWGSAGSPDPNANVYDGAWRTWYYAFRYSNRLVNYVNGVEVRNGSTRCATSCAVGDENRIYLDPGAAYTPEGRIMHELGHIASYRSSRDQQFRSGGDYCWPSTGSCTWTASSPEWSAAAFEEGLATFLGDVALWWSGAPQPLDCLSAAACTPALPDDNVELSLGVSGTCRANENRYPLLTLRYLWDIYDTTADGEGANQPYYSIPDAINSFANGRGNRQKDEPWCCVLGACWLCERDGRSGVDFFWNYQSTYGIYTSNEYYNNCAPQGG